MVNNTDIEKQHNNTYIEKKSNLVVVETPIIFLVFFVPLCTLLFIIVMFNFLTVPIPAKICTMEKVGTYCVIRLGDTSETLDNYDGYCDNLIPCYSYDVTINGRDYTNTQTYLTLSENYARYADTNHYYNNQLLLFFHMFYMATYLLVFFGFAIIILGIYIWNFWIVKN